MSAPLTPEQRIEVAAMIGRILQSFEREANFFREDEVAAWIETAVAAECQGAQLDV